MTDSFTLTGPAGSTVAENGEVTYVVTTNNTAGYNGDGGGKAPVLAPTLVGNPDSIPIGNLSVRETGATAFTPLSDTVPVMVHAQAVRSDEEGDELSTDYSVDIPFVNEDTYTATLTYTATTL